MKKIAVLISGNGSNLQAIINFLENCKLAEVSVVISNKKDAFGLERAKSYNIPTYFVSTNDYSNREMFDEALMQILNLYDVDLVCLAGFMRILTEKFTNYFKGKLINIHPSLLPKYKGLNTHYKAIENKDKFAGATVHFVTVDLDSGPLIAQVKVLLNSKDDVFSLSQKVNQNEIKLYPLVLSWFIQDKLKFINDTIYFNNKPLQKEGLQFTELELDNIFKSQIL